MQIISCPSPHLSLPRLNGSWHLAAYLTSTCRRRRPSPPRVTLQEPWRAGVGDGGISVRLTSQNARGGRAKKQPRKPHWCVVFVNAAKDNCDQVSKIHTACLKSISVYCYRPTPKSNFALVFVFFFLQDVDLEDFYFGSLNIDSSIVKCFQVIFSDYFFFSFTHCTHS